MSMFIINPYDPFGRPYAVSSWSATWRLFKLKTGGRRMVG